MPVQKDAIRDRERSEVAVQVAGEVRAWLARRRLSGNAAALRLGWSQPYISKRLNGHHAFDLDDLAQLADLLGVPVVAFFDAPSTGKGPISDLDRLAYPDSPALTCPDARLPIPIGGLNPDRWPESVQFGSLLPASVAA